MATNVHKETTITNREISPFDNVKNGWCIDDYYTIYSQSI